MPSNRALTDHTLVEECRPSVSTVMRWVDFHRRAPPDCAAPDRTDPVLMEWADVPLFLAASTADKQSYRRMVPSATPAYRTDPLRMSLLTELAPLLQERDNTGLPALGNVEIRSRVLEGDEWSSRSSSLSYTR